MVYFGHLEYIRIFAYMIRSDVGEFFTKGYLDRIILLYFECDFKLDF